MPETDSAVTFKGPEVHDDWWNEQVGELLERAEKRSLAQEGSDEEDPSERYLGHVRLLLDTAIEALQNHALHNPCGDGETVELADGTQMCAGCIDEDDAVRQQ